MRGRLASVGIATAVFLAAPHGSIAQNEMSAEGRRELEAFTAGRTKQNFADWKGIALHCAIDEPSSIPASRVCENTYTNAEFLAATANVPFVKVKDGYEIGIRSLLGEYLVLQVSVFATKQGMGPTAMFASVRAYVSYSQARESGYLAQKRNDPRTKSRSGDMTMWERGIVGASGGDGSDLVQPLSQSVEQLLKQFFADFINARK